MATYFSIYMDYLRATSCVRELESIADSLKSCANDELECNRKLQSMWQGDSANAYCSKMTVSAENITSVSDQIQRIAETVNRIATRTYNAEREALDRARNREY